MISDMIAHRIIMLNTIIFEFNLLNCALMFIISNHIGRKCLTNLFQLERSNVMFKVISDKMAHWYALLNTFFCKQFCNAIEMSSALMFIISNHYGRKCLNYFLSL